MLEPYQTLIFNMPNGQPVDIRQLALSRQHDYRLVSVSRCPIVSGKSYQLEFERVTKYIPKVRPKRKKKLIQRIIEAIE
jgi:hypothetical protein